MPRKLRFLAVLVVIAAAWVVTQASANVQTVGVVVNDPSAFDGYTIFAPNNYATTYLIDNGGHEIHTWQSGAGGLTTYLMDDGSMMRPLFLSNPNFDQSGGTGRVERVDWDGNLVWQYDYSNADHRLHHDIESMPNGNVLMIAWEYRSAAEAIAEGRDPARLPDGQVWPEHIIEVQPTGLSSGTIVWEWHVWDHMIQDFDPTKDNYGAVADHPELIDINYGSVTNDWQHANAIDYNPDLDQIILSARSFNEFWIIDHSTTTAEAAGHTGGDHGKGGDLLYRWGNPQSYDRGTLADRTLFLQHDAHWIAPGLPGAGNIMVFNNGNGRPGGNYSSVDELAPPVDGSGDYALVPGQAYGPTSLEWTYSDPPDFYSGFISGAQRLPNGDTLINSGAQGGTMFEVTPSGDVVWRYINPVGSSGPVLQGTIPVNSNVFRAYRYPASNPGLGGRDLTPGSTVETADSDKDGLGDDAEMFVYGTDYLNPDTDGDGCTDGAEVLLPAYKGGERDPTNPWDFYDVSGFAGAPRDGIVDLTNDILGVILHYAPTGTEPAYDVAFDRGPSAGPNGWNMTAPDGVIDLNNDILGVILQYGVDCR